MGVCQRSWANPYETGPLKHIFCIIFAIFYAALEFVTYVISPVEFLLKFELI